MRVIETEEIAPGVGLEDFKRSVHMAAEDIDNDAALTLALESAESAICTATGYPLTIREVEFVVTRGSWSRWWFPVLPVQELTGLALDDGVGGWADTPLAGAWVQQGHDEPQLVLGESWAGHAATGDVLRVQARVGGPDKPTFNRLRQAIFLQAKEWFEAGIAIEAEDTPRMSFGVHRLIKQARYRRPCEVI
ncbi:hypothetical protein [Leisingera sp. M523]|uniref:hypothetical protein n=1 Tax=Leisingera sp. M523 TaxID=2867013 RepID=UPI0021A64393|nr:hypothetical protein [Leisingera sp. M523]UWQ29911.1 hypothetical protein K3557_05015 [Leisingera sp. M523]